MDRIDKLTDQMVIHQQNGEFGLVKLLYKEIKDLSRSLDSDNEEDSIFWAKYLGDKDHL